MITELGGTIYNSLEEYGFSSSHRRDGVDLSTEISMSESSQIIGSDVLENSQIESLSVDKLTAGTLRVGSYILGGATGYNNGTGFFLGDEDGSDVWKFFIGNSAGNKLTWDGSVLAITGSITATSGAIGGWSINTTSIYTGTEDHSGYTANAGDITIYSDGTNSSIHANKFYIDDTGVFFATGGTFSGAVTATSGSITGAFTIGTSGSLSSGQTAYDTGTGYWLEYNSGTPRFSIGNSAGNRLTWNGTALAVNGATLTSLATGSEIAIQDWVYSGAFSVTDSDTVAWAGGTLTLMTGATYTITGSNTGNMAAFTYIYLDISVSTTAFQVATSFTSGSGKILIATAQNGTTEASYLLMGGSGDYYLDGGNITASSIIAGKLSVSQLSAITADLGTITAGTVTGATIQTASSGDRFVMTSTSFQGINSSAATIFEIILSGANAADVILGDDATGRYAQWDNSASSLSIYGDLLNPKSFEAGIAITKQTFVSIESDSKIYPTRISNFDSSEDTQDSTGTFLDRGYDNDMAFITRNIIFHIQDDNGDAGQYQRLTFDVDNDAITAISHSGTITSMGVDWHRVNRLSETKALVTNFTSPNTYTQVVSGLDTTVTQNAVTSFAGVYPVNERYTDTQGVCVFVGSGSDVQFRKLDIDGSNNITAGDETLIYTTTATKIHDIVRFGTTDYYCVLFEDGSGQRVIVFGWDGTTLTAGSVATVDSDASLYPSICNLDSTRCAVSWADNTDLKTVIVSRSGTVPTVGTEVSIDTANANSRSSTIRIGDNSYAILFWHSATETHSWLIRVTSTTPATLGTETTIETATAVNESAGGVLVSSKHIIYEHKITGTNKSRFEMMSLTNTYDDAIGVSAEDIAASATGDIFFDSYGNGFTGLTLGTVYYLGPDGEMLTYEKGGLSKGARAISTTELKIDIPL